MLARWRSEGRSPAEVRALYAAVPTDPSDARLDLVLTEREAIDCRVR
jgi:hypothetical protein